MSTEFPYFPEFTDNKLSIQQLTSAAALEDNSAEYLVTFAGSKLGTFSVDPKEALFITPLKKLYPAQYFSKLINPLKHSRLDLHNPAAERSLMASLYVADRIRAFNMSSSSEREAFQGHVVRGNFLAIAMHLDETSNPLGSRWTSLQKVLLHGGKHDIEHVLAQPRGTTWTANALAAMLPGSEMSMLGLMEFSHALTKRAK